MPTPSQPSLHQSTALRLGFVPLVDAAPMIVAKEFGLFDAEGLSVELVREPGWATVRDKLVLGRQLHGAHALAGLAFATSYGIGCIQHHCVTGYVMNRHGNGVTLSRELWEAGVQTPADLGRWMSGTNSRPLRFGIVHPASSHHFLLRSMLGRVGLRLGEDAEVVVLPPELMALNLAQGRIDGFCAGEPWNSTAISAGTGFCVATSSELCQGHPEKVFLVPASFAERSHEMHMGLIRALAAAGRVCDDPAQRPAIAKLIASSAYLDLPLKIVANSFGESFHRGFDQFAPGDSIHAFSGDDVNRPSTGKADLVLGQLRDCGLIEGKRPSTPTPKQIFREDIYEEALANRSAPSPGALAV